MFKSAFTVAGFTLMSRILGFGRELLIAGLLGTGPVADAFYAAFRFPNLFRRLFGEGAFNAAFIPLFAKEAEAGGRSATRSFATEVFSSLLLVLLVLTGLAELFMPVLVPWIIAPFFKDPAKVELTVLLTRIMFPYLMFMSLVAMFSGILNSYRKFAAAAFAPVLLNIAVIAALLAALFIKSITRQQAGQMAAWAVAVSGVLQLVLLYVAVRRQGFSFGLARPRLTPRVKRLLVLAVPGAIAGGITQINLLIGQMIASQQAGAISTLNYADRIYQLPLGVIGIAIGVVLLPEISRRLRTGDEAGVLDSQNRALEFSMFLTVPAAVALMAIPLPVIQVLFEHGRFSAADSTATANALMAFAMGLPAFVMIKIFSPGFFAREDTRTPMYFSGISVIINIAASLLLFPYLAHVGVAIATTLAGWTNALLLAVTLGARGGFAADKGLRARLPRILAASLIMGAGLLAVRAGLDQMLGTGITFIWQLAALIVLILTGAVVYFGLAGLMGIYSRADLRAAMSRKS